MSVNGYLVRLRPVGTVKPRPESSGYLVTVITSRGVSHAPYPNSTHRSPARINNPKNKNNKSKE